MVDRCNNVPDCADHTDEYDCEILLLDEHVYRKQFAPIADAHHHVEVKVATLIVNIGNFDDLTMTYTIKFKLILKWYDHHLTFANLKDNFHDNLVGYEKKHSIWIPPICMNNSDGNVWVSVDEPSSKVYVEKQGIHEEGPISELHETHYYAGDDNNLIFEAMYENKFHCSYDLHCFPFDTQVCGMEVNTFSVTLCVCFIIYF